MKAKEIRFIDNKYKYLFELPFSYGYATMLNMAQFVIDSFFSGKLMSCKVSLLVGMPEKECNYLLKFNNYRLDRCKKLQKEYGVIMLKGKSEILDDEIEIAWFNQTNILGVAGSFGDEMHRAKVELLLDEISEHSLC